MKVVLLFPALLLGFFFSIHLFAEGMAEQEKTIRKVHVSGEIYKNIGAHSLHGIAADGEGNLYIGKEGREIIRIDVNGNVEEFASIKKNMHSPENVGIYIRDLEFGPGGVLYAAARTAVLRIESRGDIEPVIDTSDMPGKYKAAGIEFDSQGNMYISGGNRVFIFDRDFNRSVFLDGKDNPQVKLESIVGIQFNDDFSVLYLAESMYGQLIECTIGRKGQVSGINVVFADYFYAPEYICCIEEGVIAMKDPGFTYFYVVDSQNIIQLYVDSTAATCGGMETFIVSGNRIIGTSRDDGNLYSIDLNNIK